MPDFTNRARLTMLAGLVVLGGALAGTAQPEHSASNPPPTFKPGLPEPCFAPRMRVVVVFPDDTQVHYTRVDMLDIKPDEGTWSVYEVMEVASRPEGPRAFRFEARGSGTTAFVTSIAGMPNEGGGEGKRNWQYWINDDFAKQGVGSARMKPGDRLTWAFLPYSTTPPRRPD